MSLPISSARSDAPHRNLAQAKTPLGQFYYGLSLTEQSKYEDTIKKALTGASKAGYAASEVALHKAAALRGLGKYEESLETLRSLESYVHKSAEYLYQYGAVLNATGDVEASIPYFEQAVAADPRHAGALFQLAYHNDMNGNDDEAIGLYERCLQLPPREVGTLINLGIHAKTRNVMTRPRSAMTRCSAPIQTMAVPVCFTATPASTSQLYDEDAERRSDRYNAVLDIPVTDFELSVTAAIASKR
ncbi:MAG: tetratricopeptide repeat protein [Planctomycetota bacterium]